MKIKDGHQTDELNNPRSIKTILMLLLGMWTFVLAAATQRVLVHEVKLESAGGLRWLMLNHFWKMEIIIALISFAVGLKNQGRGLSVWLGSQLIMWQLLITFIVAKNYWG